MKGCRHEILETTPVKGFYPEYNAIRVKCVACGKQDKYYTEDKEVALAWWQTDAKLKALFKKTPRLDREVFDGK